MFILLINIFKLNFYDISRTYEKKFNFSLNTVIDYQKMRLIGSENA